MLLFPLNSGGWFAGDVIDDPTDLGNAIDDLAGDVV